MKPTAATAPVITMPVITPATVAPELPETEETESLKMSFGSNLIMALNGISTQYLYIIIIIIIIIALSSECGLIRIILLEHNEIRVCV